MTSKPQHPTPEQPWTRLDEFRSAPDGVYLDSDGCRWIKGCRVWTVVTDDGYLVDHLEEYMAGDLGVTITARLQPVSGTDELAKCRRLLREYARVEFRHTNGDRVWAEDDLIRVRKRVREYLGESDD